MGKLEGFACVVEAPLLKVPTMDRVNARVSYASKQLGLRGEMAPSQATSILLYLWITEPKYEMEYQGYFSK